MSQQDKLSTDIGQLVAGSPDSDRTKTVIGVNSSGCIEFLWNLPFLPMGQNRPSAREKIGETIR